MRFGAGAEILRAAQELLSGLRVLVFYEVVDKVTMGVHRSCEIAGQLKSDDDRFGILLDGSRLPHRERKDYLEIIDYLAAPREKEDRVY